MVKKMQNVAPKFLNRMHHIVLVGPHKVNTELKRHSVFFRAYCNCKLIKQSFHKTVGLPRNYTSFVTRLLNFYATVFPSPTSQNGGTEFQTSWI